MPLDYERLSRTSRPRNLIGSGNNSTAPSVAKDASFATDNVSYTLQVNVTTEVPVNYSSNVDSSRGALDSGQSVLPANQTTLDTTQYFTASTFSLSGLNPDPGSDVRLCMVVWSGLATNITENTASLPAQDGNGCGNYLSERCIQDIVANAPSSPNCASGSDTTFFPPSCESQRPSEISLAFLRGRSFRFQ